MRSRRRHHQQRQRQQFEKKQQRQLQAMDLRAALLGLNLKIPEQQAGNGAADESGSAKYNSPPAPVAKPARSTPGDRSEKESCRHQQLDGLQFSEGSGQILGDQRGHLRATLAAGVRPGLLLAREVVGILLGEAGINVDLGFLAGFAIHNTQVAVFGRGNVLVGEELDDEQGGRAIAQAAQGGRGSPGQSRSLTSTRTPSRRAVWGA